MSLLNITLLQFKVIALLFATVLVICPLLLFDNNDNNNVDSCFVVVVTAFSSTTTVMRPTTTTKTSTKLSQSSSRLFGMNNNNNNRHSNKDIRYLIEDFSLLENQRKQQQQQQQQVPLINYNSIIDNQEFGNNDIETQKVTSNLLSTLLSEGGGSSNTLWMVVAIAIGVVGIVVSPLPVEAAMSTGSTTTLNIAAASDTPGVIPTALVAYSHYLFILITFGLLVYERITIQPNMSIETEKSLVVADSAYGISALLLLISGYYRVIEYGKGWDYYSHEPLFWFKLSNLSILASLSFFITIILIKRGIPLFQQKLDDSTSTDLAVNSSFIPMTEKLAKRMHQIINAEISALLIIPLFASLMARGVLYNNDFPWQAGAAFVAVTFTGSSFIYIKQALTWSENE